MKPPEAKGKLATLGRKIIQCQACPRLITYLSGIHEKNRSYWSHPVPGVGDPKAQLLLVGLAPGMRGANRTGRMFTGDHSGQWLYRALYETGFGSKAVSEGPGDGLTLRNIYITSAGRCAPPQNRPTGKELSQCRHWLEEEYRLLPQVQIFLAIGKIGHDAILKILEHRLSDYPFKHAAEHSVGKEQILLDTYHCSRQNTNTGRLTWDMWIQIFRRARQIISTLPAPK